jgi:DNA-binding transcriptional MerR regulator/methylmalonyl-CoA mutase cobalamin-binding subunit
MNAAPPELRYPIRAVAKLTGIPLDTLRAWERRYRAVTPQRDGRQRVYTDADIARLNLLRRAVSAGHAIGRAAAMSDRELTAVLDAHVTLDGPPVSTVTATSPGPARVTAAATLTDKFAAALSALDTAAVDAEFSRLAATLPPVALVRDVLMPALRVAGDGWMHTAGRIAQEHLVSATMRHLMGSFLRLFVRQRGATRLLFATPSGDRHELGILGAAVLAASAGTDVTYLGPDLPAAEILAAAEASGADVVVLGLTLASADTATAHEVRMLARDLPAAVELWAGGAAASAYAAELGPRARTLTDLDAYLAQLTRLDYPHA